MPHLGPTEIGLIVFLVLMIFGAGKLPHIGSALGRGIREFRRATTGELDMVHPGAFTATSASR